jgi:hypothetical protein
MTTTFETRKPIDTITADDLEAFPIWEYCLDEEGIDGMDETWVRPVAAARVPLNDYSLTVAADLTPKSGPTTLGFVGISTVQPIEVAGIGFLTPEYNWIQSTASGDERQTLAATVGAKIDDIFPITYRLRVPIEGETSRRTRTID